MIVTTTEAFIRKSKKKRMNDSGVGNSPQCNGDVEVIETRSIPSANSQISDARRKLKTSIYRKPKSNHTSSLAEQLYELEGIEKSLLFRQLRPLFSCMRIFGIYFNHRTAQSGRRSLRLPCNCSLQQFYCLFVNAVLLCYLIWSLVAFRVCLYTRFLLYEYNIYIL